MSNFLRLDKTRLTNGQHYAFMEAFLSLLDGAGLEGSKISTLRDRLEADFRREDEQLIRERGSRLTAQVEAANTRRARNFGWLKRLAAIWAEGSYEPEATHAARLRLTIRHYRIDINAQYDDLSGLLTNLLQDISESAELTAAVDAIGARRFVQSMAAANDDVIRLLAERDAELTARGLSQLRAIRQDCDRRYDELLLTIEAFGTLADDAAPYDAFIVAWNGTVDRYKDMLRRKSAPPSVKKGED